jgi:hypothetical protein
MNQNHTAGLAISCPTQFYAPHKPVSRTVTVPETTAASAGVFLSDHLRDRVASLATAQNVTPGARKKKRRLMAALTQKQSLIVTWGLSTYPSTRLPFGTQNHSLTGQKNGYI